MFVILLTYLKPLAEVDRFLAEHRAFLQRGYADGLLLASGPQTPRTGGVILARGADRAAIEALVAQDPFHREQIARYDIIGFEPVLSAEGLAAVLSAEPNPRPPVSPRQSIALTTLVVRDYDEAIGFYRDRLGFRLVEDSDQGEGKRWVVVAPPGGSGTGLLLARAADAAQAAAIGRNAGGRVGLFLNTDDFWRDHAAFSARGVRFARPPRTEPYGVVAVFEDLYGNLWDLIQPGREGALSAS